MSLFRASLPVLFIAVAALTVPSGHAEVTRGEMLANSCAACHGTDGSGSKRIPRINDLGVSDTIELMKSFKEGGGGGTVMNRHATGYTDEEIRLIAEHFAKIAK